MFEVHSNHDLAGNHFRCLTPQAEKWLERLADYYLSLRSSPVVSLDPSIFEGTAFNMDQINRVVNASVIPPRRAQGDKQRHLCTVRSDFGEAIAIKIFENLYGTKFGWIGLRDRATTAQPGPGTDSIGIEGDDHSLRVIFLEVKVSTQAPTKKPPQVVQGKADSLYEQHRKHVQQRYQESVGKVVRAANSSRDRLTRRLLLLAAAHMDARDQNDKVSLVCGSVLIRPASFYGAHEYGDFRTNPENFEPAKIRFFISLADDDLEKQVDDWHAILLKRVGGAG